ncbi:MAG: DinB family protein [Actinomycetota bacterium]
MTERALLTLESIADAPEVGRWLSALDDGRHDTVRELDDVTDDMVDLAPSGAPNSIGTLLYHVALIELDWLLEDILGPERDVPWPETLVPFEDRDGEGTLTVVRGETIAMHVERLARVRALVHVHLTSMSVEDFHTPRPRERYDVSPAWVLHHLLQHEAEHRAHIAWVRDAILGRLGNAHLAQPRRDARQVTEGPDRT